MFSVRTGCATGFSYAKKQFLKITVKIVYEGRLRSRLLKIIIPSSGELVSVKAECCTLNERWCRLCY